MNFERTREQIPRISKFLSALLVLTLLSTPWNSNAVSEKISAPSKSLKSKEPHTARNVLSDSTVIDGGNTLAFSGSINLSDGTPVESATILFKNGSNGSNPWFAVFSDSNGKFKTDLVPGSWTWRVISFNDYGDGSRTQNYPYETDVLSSPSLPRHFIYGDALSISAAETSTLEITLPLRKVRIQVTDETGTAVSGAKLFYSPYLTQNCNQPSETRYKCLRPMRADINGILETTVFTDNCLKCRDEWHESNLWQETRTVSNLTNLGLSRLTNPNYETVTGTIYAVDPNNPAVFKSILASNLTSGSNLLSLPNPVELNGYVTYSNTGLTNTGDTSTIAVVRYYNEVLGIASPSTVNVDNLGKYTIKASPNQSGIFEVLLRNPDTTTIANNLPLETQFSQPGKFVAGYSPIFGQSQFLAPNIDTSTSQLRNFTIPSYRKVNLNIGKWIFDSATPANLVTVPALSATINTGYEEDLSRNLAAFSNLIKNLSKQTINETGTASYYIAKTALGYPNESGFYILDSLSSMQLPQTCTAMYRADAHECGYLIDGSQVISNWSTYKFITGAVRPLIFTEDTSTVSININFPRTALFNGIVKSRDNKAIEGALVGIREKNENSFLQTFTDVNGFFQISASPQTLTNMSGGGVVVSISGNVRDREFNGMSDVEKSLFSTSSKGLNLPQGFRQILSARPSNWGALDGLTDGETITVVVPATKQIVVNVKDPISDEYVPNALVQISPQVCSDTSTVASIKTNLSNLNYAGGTSYSICGTASFGANPINSPTGSSLSSSQVSFTTSNSEGIAKFNVIAKSDAIAGQTYSIKVYDPRNFAREVTFAISAETDETITVRLPAPPPPPTQLLVSSAGDINAGVSELVVDITPPSGSDLADTGSFGLDGFVVEAIPVSDGGASLKRKNLVSKSKSGQIVTPTTVKVSLRSSDTRTAVSGLIPGVRYNLQVKSWNEAGFGKARKIFINNGYSAPTPPAPRPPRTPSATPTPSPSPTPTESPSPTDSPSPIALVSPSPTPLPNVSPTPSLTPSPTATPKPSTQLTQPIKVNLSGALITLSKNPVGSLSLNVGAIKSSRELVVPASKSFSPKIEQLRPNSVIKIFVEKNGKKEYLTQISTDRKGNLQLPVIKLSSGKTLRIFLRDSSQKNFAINFRAK